MSKAERFAIFMDEVFHNAPPEQAEPCKEEISEFMDGGGWSTGEDCRTAIMNAFLKHGLVKRH